MVKPFLSWTFSRFKTNCGHTIWSTCLPAFLAFGIWIFDPIITYLRFLWLAKDSLKSCQIKQQKELQVACQTTSQFNKKLSHFTKWIWKDCVTNSIAFCCGENRFVKPATHFTYYRVVHTKGNFQASFLNFT